MFDKITEVSLLYDFYGQLLTERQRDVMQLYHEENYSLAEIAEEFSISRQGVHDALKNAERALTEYEDKLGLVRRLDESGKKIAKAEALIKDLEKEHSADETLVKKLEEIREIIEDIEL